jgi:hypothetical protein
MATERGLSRKGTTMRDRLLQFYHGQDIILNAEEERTKLRLEEVHKLLRSWQYKREEIIQMISSRFPDVSKWRAERDIADCHFIFGKSYQVNPGFIIAQLIEEIQDSIRTAKLQKKFELLPKLYDSLTKAIQQLPEENSSPVKAKKIYVFNIHGNKEYNAKMDTQTAIDILKSEHIEDIDHEELR